MSDINVASFADDNTPYMSAENQVFLSHLGSTIWRIFKWFSDCQLKGNGGKCHTLLSTNEEFITNTNSAQIGSSHSEKLLGVIIGHKLNFK